ncbi:MAG: dehydratase [Hyphomicrobiaceae bacterium]|nr:dehydratase [Hyphomicrobiaceae bacterium]
MPEFYVKVGDGARFSKTVGEYDVYDFAGIPGDFSPNHVDKSYMQKSSYGRLQPHGTLLVGYMSTASTANTRPGADETPVSLGYDRVRVVGPIYFGDTITVDYRITAVNPERSRATANVEIRNRNDELVSVGTHIPKWVKNARL